MKNPLFSANAPLFQFDATILPFAIKRLIGVDEVGRGSLIGAVVAAAFTWNHHVQPTAEEQTLLLHTLNDSKKLTATKRAVLVPVLQRLGYWGVGEASAEEIANLNVQQASFLAGWRAMQALALHRGQPLDTMTDFLLIDGRLPLPHYPITSQQAIIKGDGQSAVIAAASILAKEYRDAWVRQQALSYPIYGWERNMGYATVQHRTAIAQHGVSPLHRPSFQLATLK